MDLEVLPQDLCADRRGNLSIDYVHSLESGVPGADVVLNALTHGNEFCGMVAVVDLLEPGVRARKRRAGVRRSRCSPRPAFDFPGCRAILGLLWLAIDHSAAQTRYLHSYRPADKCLVLSHHHAGCGQCGDGQQCLGGEDLSEKRNASTATVRTDSGRPRQGDRLAVRQHRADRRGSEHTQQLQRHWPDVKQLMDAAARQHHSAVSADGERLYQRYQRVLDEVETLRAEAAGSRSAPTGKLLVPALVFYGRRFVMPLLAKLLQQHSGLRLEMRLTDLQVDLVRDGLATMRSGFDCRPPGAIGLGISSSGVSRLNQSLRLEFVSPRLKDWPRRLVPARVCAAIIALEPLRRRVPAS